MQKFIQFTRVCNNTSVPGIEGFRNKIAREGKISKLKEDNPTKKGHGVCISATVSGSPCFPVSGHNKWIEVSSNKNNCISVGI